MRRLVVLAEQADRRDQVGRVAGEPGRLVVVGGTRLARDLLSVPRGVALHGALGRTVVDHAGQHRGDRVGGLAADDLLADRVGEGDRPGVVLDRLHERRGDLPAVVVEGRVDAGHLQRARAHGAERLRGHGLHVLGVHAEPAGDLHDLGHADVDAHLREDGVDGIVHRPLDGDLPVAPVVLVLRGEPDLGAVVDDRPLARAVVDRARPDRPAVLGLGVLLQGGGQDDRLEGGGGLVVRAGRVVDVVPQVVLAAVHRDDRARLRVHGGGAGLDVRVHRPLLRVQLAVQLPLDGLLQGRLLLLVDVQGDGPAPLVDHRLRRFQVIGGALGDQLLLQRGVGRLHQVAGLALQAGVVLGLLRHRERHGVALALAQPALLDHVVEDVVPAGPHQPLALVAGDRPVVLVRRLEQRGEVGALLDGEVLRVDLVVGLGGGLDAVGAAAVVAGVDVAGQDVVLGLLPVQLQRDDQFLQLARDGLFLRQVVVLDVLLGDGGTTLGALAGDRVQQAAGGALQVDTGVLVEGLVLGGDEGLLDGLGDLAQVHDLAVAVTCAGQERAVAVLVDVALPLGVGVPLGDVDHHVQHDEGAHAQQAQAEERAEDLLPGEEPAYAALPGSARRTAAPGCRPAPTALSGASLFRSSHRSDPLRFVHVCSCVTQVRRSGQLRKLTPGDKR